MGACRGAAALPELSAAQLELEAQLRLPVTQFSTAGLCWPTTRPASGKAAEL